MKMTRDNICWTLIAIGWLVILILVFMPQESGAGQSEISNIIVMADSVIILAASLGLQKNLGWIKGE